MKASSAKLIYFLSTTPLLWVVWFYFYVVRQRLHLGFWPRPGLPDPKDAGYMLHHLSIYVGVLLAPNLAVVAIALILQRRLRERSFRWWLAGVLLVLSVACYLAVMFIDPGDYWLWFRD